MFTPEIRAMLDVACGLPTNLHKLGERLGVVEVEWKDLDVDGMVLPKTRGYKVVLNSNRARSRFSWAHELGHVIIQSGALDSPQFRGHLAGHKKIEKMCDELATEILMPKKPFLSHMTENGLTMSSIPVLARTFDTSILSTARRFRDFLPFPAVLSKWKLTSRQPMALAHDWSVPNPKCRPYRYGLPKGNQARNAKVKGPYLAFRSSGLIKSEEPLMVARSSKRGDSFQWATFPTESMAFGAGENRYVLSLSYVGGRSPGIESLPMEA